MNLTCTIKLEVKIASQITAEIGIKRKRALQQSVSILFRSKESWSLQQSRRLIKPLKSSKPKLLDQSILGSLYDSGKLPTYPSPKPTSTLTSLLGQNVGLGEGRLFYILKLNFLVRARKRAKRTVPGLSVVNLLLCHWSIRCLDVRASSKLAVVTDCCHVHFC